MKNTLGKQNAFRRSKVNMMASPFTLWSLQKKVVKYLVFPHVFQANTNYLKYFQQILSRIEIFQTDSKSHFKCKHIYTTLW